MVHGVLRFWQCLALAKYCDYPRDIVCLWFHYIFIVIVLTSLLKLSTGVFVGTADHGQEVMVVCLKICIKNCVFYIYCF
jgi:hypothetical protein